MSNSPLKFNDYIVDKIDISVSTEFLNEEKSDVSIKPNFFAEIIRNNDDKAMVVLSFDLENGSNNLPFEIHTSIVGLFELSSNEYTEEMYISLLKNNAVAILFPYLRSLISDLTMKLNVSNTLVLPSMNIVELLKNNDNYKITNASDLK